MYSRHKNSQAFGAQQEQLAASYLQARGLVLLQSNFRCRVGEIDLIMRDDRVLVFIEVRYRRNKGFGTSVETVDRRKQQKLRRCARFFLATHGLTEQLVCRFDIIGLTAAPGQEIEFNWIPNAFH
ncbi:MAG: YraN family protein [Pseudomonadales bacterium]|nr:YraN family protein [Pseudomonadales bacterium]